MIASSGAEYAEGDQFVCLTNNAIYLTLTWHEGEDGVSRWLDAEHREVTMIARLPGQAFYYKRNSPDSITLTSSGEVKPEQYPCVAPNPLYGDAAAGKSSEFLFTVPPKTRTDELPHKIKLISANQTTNIVSVVSSPDGKQLYLTGTNGVPISKSELATKRQIACATEKDAKVMQRTLASRVFGCPDWSQLNFWAAAFGGLVGGFACWIFGLLGKGLVWLWRHGRFGLPRFVALCSEGGIAFFRGVCSLMRLLRAWHVRRQARAGKRSRIP